MEFQVKATVDITRPTPDQLRAIRARVRNLLLDFGDDINVIVDFAPTELWTGSGVARGKVT